MSGYHAPLHERRDLGARAEDALIGLIAVGLAAYAAAASYESVAALAARHGLPLAWLCPAGIDGGLFGVIAVDIALTRRGEPVGWLRLAARLFAAATIAANAAAGWPDPVSAALRVAAPALFVILVEVARCRLLRKHRGESGRDGIPLWRWLLAPAATFALWRRMKLWGVRSYRTALDMEISRLRAVEQLRARFPRQDWREAIPGDVAWCLEQGVRMGETLERVAGLCAPSPAVSPLPAGASPVRAAGARKRPAGKRRAGGGATTIDSQAQALAEYQKNPAVNGSQMARALGLSASRGRALVAMAREAAKHETGPMAAVREEAR